MIRALDNAPLAGAADFTPEEIAHLEAVESEGIVLGPGNSTAEMLEMLADQSNHRQE